MSRDDRGGMMDEEKLTIGRLVVPGVRVACHRLVRLVVLCVLVVGSVAGYARGYTPRADVNPRRITVGDPIEVNITIGGVPLGTSVAWPVGDRFTPAEILKTDTLSVNAGDRGQRYSISLYKPGPVDLPDVPVLITSGFVTDTVWVKLGQIEVASVITPQDSADIRDIRPPVKLPWTLKDMMPYLIGAAVALLLAALGIYLWRRWKRSKGEIEVYIPPPPPPDKIALERLAELKLKKLWQNGFLKEYHSELTDILKDYIGGRWDFNAPEMTTEELLYVNRTKWLVNDELYHLVRRTLSSADLIKFAKYKPEPAENEQNWEWVHRFVVDSKPPVGVRPVSPDVEGLDSRLRGNDGKSVNDKVGAPNSSSASKDSSNDEAGRDRSRPYNVNDKGGGNA